MRHVNSVTVRSLNMRTSILENTVASFLPRIVALIANNNSRGRISRCSGGRNSILGFTAQKECDPNDYRYQRMS
jgi:hypothetical protein